MTVYRLGDRRPTIAETAYVAPTAAVIGDVSLADDVSVWFGAVIRGDNDRITIESGANVQECAVLHVDPGHPLRIGRDVTIGHSAIVHGCDIGDGSLIGINATILNDAVIGKQSIVGAGSVVPERKQYPDRSLILGSPGKVVRELSDADIEWMTNNARDYVARAEQYRNMLFALEVVEAV